MASRPLTQGEISLARQVFKTSITYPLVLIHNEPYAFFQPNRSGMTPNGEIYIKGKNIYSNDYSKTIPQLKAFYIHEMVHVWQYQNKILRPISAAISESISNGFDYQKAYEYELDSTFDLTDYKIEQQAAIIEDYYWYCIIKIPSPHARIKNKITNYAKTIELKTVLQNFLQNPGYARNKAFPGKKKKIGAPGKRR